MNEPMESITFSTGETYSRDQMRKFYRLFQNGGVIPEVVKALYDDPRINPDIEEWERFVLNSYSRTVDSQEYVAKATQAAVKKVAYYLLYNGYNMVDDEEGNIASFIQTLLDFQAFTEHV